MVNRFVACRSSRSSQSCLPCSIGAIIIVLSSLDTEGSLNFLLPVVAYESLIEGATGLSFLNVTDGGIALAISIDPERAARA